MKRIFSVFVLFLGLVFGANAQGLEAGNLSFGVRAGVGLANMGGDVKNSDNLFNFHVGVVGDYAFTNNFYLEPGLYFTRKGCSFDKVSYESFPYKTESVSRNLYYLEIPVLASYRFNINDAFGINVQAGPYAAIGLFGDTDDVKSFDDGNCKRFDAGARFAAGVQFSAFSATVGYDLGLMNIADVEEGDYKATTSLISLTLGYDF